MSQFTSRITTSTGTTSKITTIAPPTLQLRLFGAPSIYIHNKPITSLPTKAQALLAYLALTRQTQLRSTLANLLWDEMTEDRALANLRKVLQKLRKAMPDQLMIGYQSVSLAIDTDVWVDVLAFENELAHSLSASNANSFNANSFNTNSLEEVLQYYREDFLAGFYVRKASEFEAWQLSQRARLRESMLNTLKRLAHICIQQDNLSRAIDITVRILEYEPWREEAHRQLMRLFFQNGESGQALLHYERCRQLLEQELGVSPSQATKQLYQQIRSGQLETDAHNPSAQSTPSPEAAAPTGFKLPAWLDRRANSQGTKQLFGTQAAHDALHTHLLAPTRPWLVAIDGIGGIGKTALAQELLNDLSNASYFKQVAWVSAKQEEFQPNRGTQPIDNPAIDAEQLIDSILKQLVSIKQTPSTPAAKEELLQQILAEKPTLIVVDNLETVADYEALIPTLRAFANPSKFLITSRYSLVHEPDIYSQTLSELSQQDVLNLLRHEATMRGIRGLADADEETLAQIYAVAGGHPLTLNLILGQLNFLPLDHLLNTLQHTSSQRAEELYTYIYWQTWQLLDQSSQQLFCTMPLLQNATYAQLCAITQLPVETLQSALVKLINLSLLRVDGDLFEPRYVLHRLTETFLTNEVQRNLAQKSPIPQLLGKSSVWRDFYQQTILNGLHYWHEHPAVQEVDVQQLDQNRDGILNLIHHGLRHELAWSPTHKLIIALASYMERRGHWHLWRAILERAIETAQNANDIDGETTITALLGRVSQRQGRGPEVVRRYRRVLQLAKSQNNQYEIGRACTNLGYYYIDSSHWWRAELLNLRALEIFEELENAHGLAHANNHLGMLYTRQHHWPQAKERFERACQLWQKHGDQHSLLSGYMNLGLMHVEIGETDEAMAYLHKASRIAQHTGELSYTARILNNMAVAHHQNKAWIEAEECAKKAESLFQEYADQRGLASAWQNLGLIYADINQTQRALEYLDKALVIHRKLNNQSDIEQIREKISTL